jgi:predicted PurR-regulated permease PerM
MSSRGRELPLISTQPGRRPSGIAAVMLGAVSVVFFLILWPFFGAILWAVLLSVIFTPVYQVFLARMQRWRNVASSATVLLVAILVVVPLTLIAGALVQETSGLINRLQSSGLDVQRSILEFRSSLPASVKNLLTHIEATNITSFREWLSTALMQAGQYITSHVVSVGQVTVSFLINVFVMMYLLFYLLRDGGTLLDYVQRAIPLSPEQQQVLLRTFTATVRGTLKGVILVAVLQGVLGGLIFWVLGFGTPALWGTVMAVASLQPTFGTSLIWVPAGIYLLLTGSVMKGIVLLLLGSLVIGASDNILRPMLVGKDVKMPNYIVLVSSLGGIAIFGVNGFVIGPLLAALFLAAWDMYLQFRGAVSPS